MDFQGIDQISTRGRTGTQEKFNPEKSCRTNRNFCGVGTCLGNMPEAILTLWDDVPIVPFWQKNGWVTIRSSLCFELEQIRDHFYYTNFLFFYNKSGLRFSVTQSIAKLGFYSNPTVFFKKRVTGT